MRIAVAPKRWDELPTHRAETDCRGQGAHPGTWRSASSEAARRVGGEPCIMGHAFVVLCKSRSKVTCRAQLPATARRAVNTADTMRPPSTFHEPHYRSAVKTRSAGINPRRKSDVVFAALAARPYSGTQFTMIGLPWPWACLMDRRTPHCRPISLCLRRAITMKSGMGCRRTSGERHVCWCR